MRKLSCVILFFSILCWCSGCHNSTSKQKVVELCKEDSLCVPQYTFDKIKTEAFPSFKDTVISCSIIPELLSSGMILTSSERSLFNLPLNEDATITLIKAYKNKNGYLCFFYFEYSDLIQAIIKTYDVSGRAKDELITSFNCSSDVIDSDADIELVQCWSSMILLDRSTLEIQDKTEIYKYSDNSSILQESSENINLYSIQNGKLVSVLKY